jgi:hypothetical protein
MKRTPIFSLIIFVATTLISTVLFRSNISAIDAQQMSQMTNDFTNSTSLQHFNPNGLFYPTSPQRFFEQGYKQLDGEIQLLQKHDPASSPALNINADVLQQNQAWRQQQETWLLRQEIGNPTSPQTQPTETQ